MTERNKWGRIPAKLYEVDQEFCALINGEGKCQAGPQSNYVLNSNFSSDLFSTYWSTDGTVQSDIFGTNEPPDKALYNTINLINLPDAGFLTANSANYTLLPVFTESKTFNVSFYRRTLGGTWRAAVAVVVSSSIVANVGADIDFADPNNPTLDSGVSNYIYDDSGNWDRVSFDVDLTGYITEGEAYTVFFDFDGDPDGTAGYITEPVLSLDGLDVFRITADEPKISDDQPCFNTLSSCQDLENYTIKGQADALALIVTA